MMILYRPALTAFTAPARYVSTPMSKSKRRALGCLSPQEPDREKQDGPPALSRGRPGRARISRHAQAQHQSAQAIGQLARHGARLQRRRWLYPLQEQARPAAARTGDPAGRLAGEIGI